MPRLQGRDVSEKEFYDYVQSTTTGQLITAYPKMLYRSGAIPHNQHHHQGEAIKIGGTFEGETLTVENEDEELAALELGWQAVPVSAPVKEARRGNPA